MHISVFRNSLVALFFCGMVACSKQAQYISTVTPGENPYIIQVDSFQGNFVVFRTDSFLTSSDTFALIGHHRDTLFGSTSCAQYARFEWPGLADIPNSAKYDSIELILQNNYNAYGDSTAPMQFYVARLFAPISNETNQFYNTMKPATYPGIVGAASLRLRPHADDSIRIRIAEDLGLELFNNIRSKADVVSSTDKFQEYFKGLKLYTDQEVTSQVASFKRSIILRIHYHEDDGNITAKQIDIKSSGSTFQFNGIDKEYTGSALAAMQSAREVNSAALGNRFFVQEMMRIRTRIDFPGIRDVLTNSDYVKVLNAQLELKPVGSSWVQYPVPNQMNIYTRKIDQSLSAALINGEGQSQTGSLSIDNLYGTDTRYLYDVTDYINSELSATAFTTEQLVLIPSGTQGLMSRLAGNTTQSTEQRTRLIISLLVYKNQ